MVDGETQRAVLRRRVKFRHHVVQGIDPIVCGPDFGVPAQEVAPDEEAFAVLEKLLPELAQHGLQRGDSQRLAVDPVAEQVLKQPGGVVLGHRAKLLELFFDAARLGACDGFRDGGLNFVVAGGL